MSTLITGSLAFDSIMVFQDQFKNHILPEQTHILNVCFLVPQMRKEFGGCAGNIAYGLKLLGGEPKIMATAGADFEPYARHLTALNIDQQYIHLLDDEFTAQAFITTDLDDNQIIAFHPGAMNRAQINQIGDAKDIQLGIISPDGRDAMLQHAQQFSELNIPFIFDPGQGLPMFDGEELLNFIKQADYVIMNDYESKLLMDKTGLKLEQLAELTKAFVLTLGGQGSKIYTNDECLDIPSVAVDQAVDPTGCGDAYRSGLLYGLSKNLDWPIIGRLGSLMGAIKVQFQGPQNYHFSKAEFKQQFEHAFAGFQIDL